MASRTNSSRFIQNHAGQDNQVCRKVEAKIIQGPISRRALGELSNNVFNNKDCIKNDNDLAKKEKSKTTNLGAKEKHVLTKPEERKERLIENKENGQNLQIFTQTRIETNDITTFSSLHAADVEDIDADDVLKPSLVSEYVNDIYAYLRQLEYADTVHPKYLDGYHVTGKMRMILIDWLVQVHTRFNLIEETLYLTVGIIDRYLQIRKATPKNKLQLVGVTAMFLASKYEEMYCPEISDFSYITDKAYTIKEIRLMEIDILKTLNFNMSCPLPLHFLRRDSKAGKVDARHHALAKYVMQLCLPEYSMCHIKQSELAGASLCLALKIFQDGPTWNETLVHYSTYTEKDLLPIMSKMASLIIKASSAKQQAIFQKFKSSKFMKISTIPELKSKLVKTLAESCTL